MDEGEELWKNFGGEEKRKRREVRRKRRERKDRERKREEQNSCFLSK
jgi:hypothetical protein